MSTIQTAKTEFIYKTTKELIPYARNARTHSEEQVAEIASSIKEFGFINPVIIDAENGIIAGHGRVMAAQLLGLEKVPCIVESHLTEVQKRAYILADNRLAEKAGWDEELLRIELEELNDLDFDLSLTGFDWEDFDELLYAHDGGAPPEEKEQAPKVRLADLFGVPPFSVLNARDGWWQNRKRAWLDLGIQSETGRGEDLLLKGSGGFAEIIENAGGGTSIFDPVLCELIYRWFCKPQGVVLDPFAGGSVRGIVASKLDRQYVGVDLRAEQVEANEAQAAEICEDNFPIWHIGDSTNIDKIAKGCKADLVFSCPPYVDLEVYSDNPDDLSTMNYSDFMTAYRKIIKKSVAMLQDDAFACFVVGEARDKKGNYYGFVPDTVKAFVDAGATFYNEAILVTQAGSLPARCRKGFETSRKLGKTHQNVLIFCKGSPKKAAAKIGAVEFDNTILEGTHEHQLS